MTYRARGRRGDQWDARMVKALRAHLGLTQRQLAEELGTRQQTISEWETGMYQPRGASRTLLAIIAERADFEYGAIASGKQGSTERVADGERGVEKAKGLGMRGRYDEGKG